MRGQMILTTALTILAGAALAALAQQPRDEAALRAEIARIPQPGMMNVPRADGEYLHDLIVQRGYKRALEIGTSNGHSAAWMALALRKTGGRLITLEIDERRAALAAENFKRLGFDDIIELRRGDALKLIPEIAGPFDLVFIDAWKPDYIRYFELTFHKVRPGGAIIGHNIRSHASELQAFVRLVSEHPQLDTTIDRRSSAGMTVSFKKE